MEYIPSIKLPYERYPSLELPYCIMYCYCAITIYYFVIVSELTHTDALTQFTTRTLGRVA